MIEIARKRIPEAQFRVASMYEAELPVCDAVISIGECFNYVSRSAKRGKRLAGLFTKIHAALKRGGVLVFDISEPAQVARPVKSFTEGKGWAVLVEKQEDHRTGILTRSIITFRRAGKSYKRTKEVHRQKLYEPATIAAMLRSAGFRVRTMRNYGRFRLPIAHAAFVALKV